MQAAAFSPAARCNPDLEGAARVEGGHMIARARPRPPADLANGASRLCFQQGCLSCRMSFIFFCFLTAFYNQALSLPFWTASSESLRWRKVERSLRSFLGVILAVPPYRFEEP